MNVKTHLLFLVAVAGIAPVWAQIEPMGKMAPVKPGVGIAPAPPVKPAPPVNETVQVPTKKVFGIPDKASMEIVFVVDTTGSMGGLIDGAKKKIWSIVNEIADAKPQPEIKIGFVAYRDKGDTYVTQAHELTSDLDAAFTTLQKFNADGGGDTPEHVSAGLHEAVENLKWSKAGSNNRALYQAIFLVGDCPPHTDYDDGLSYKTEADHAGEKGIFINTIRCGGDMDTEKVWLDIATRAHGNYFSLAQSGGVVEVSTPYDSEMVRLGAELETTTIARRGGEKARNESLANAGFGGGGFGAAAAPTLPELKAKVDSGAIAGGRGFSNYMGRQAFNAKSGQLYAAFDLVTDIVNGRKVVDIKEEEWPEELKKMPLAQRRTLLSSKVEQRRKIQKQIAEIELKRAAFLRANADKSKVKDGFDQKMLGTLKSQAARGGAFSF